MDTTRDVVIITWGVLSVITLLVVLSMALMVGLAVKALVTALTVLLNDEVKPLIATSQQGLTNVTGTAQFLNETILAPLLRLIRLVAAIRRGGQVFIGLRSRVRPSTKRTGNR